MMIANSVVKTDPIEINALDLSCLVPNLNNIEVVIKIIKIKKPYRPITINGI